jgi:MFS family permease
METMLIPLLSPTTPPSVGPLISGLFLLQWAWPSIFWFLAIASALTLAVIVVFLPETCRSIVGNGSKSRLLRCHAPANLTLCPPSEGSLDIHPRETGSRSKSMFLTGPFAAVALLRQPTKSHQLKSTETRMATRLFQSSIPAFEAPSTFL